jgi:hypothetical protein
MRELTLIETGCLCAGLLLGLALPLMMSANAPQNLATRKSCLKIVWMGQMLLAVAGLVFLVSQAAAPCAMVMGAVSVLGCAMALRRMLRREPVTSA